MNKERINIFKIISFYFIYFVLCECLFLISSSFSSQKATYSKEYEIHFPPQYLIGVIVSKDTSSSIAILKDEKTGKTRLLTLGENIFDLTLTHVFENRIILQKDEKNFQIFLGRSKLINAYRELQNNAEEISVMDQKEDILISSPLNYYLKKKEFIRSEVERRIEKEWPLIMKETRFVPNLINEKISGFKITKLPKKSIISEISIYKNDVIKEINGVELNDMGALFALYKRFKDENQFKVIIERNGKLFHLIYILK